MPKVVRAIVWALLVCTAVVSSYAGTTAYDYDVHGRLKRVTAPNGTDQTITTYTLDNAGNRQTVAVTFADTTPPNPPTAPNATPLDFQTISVSWTTSLDVGGAAVSYYRVFRGGQLIASPNGPAYPNTATFTDWPLAASTTYSYTVAAVDAAGNQSAQSAQVSATTPSGADLVPPTAPTNLQGTPLASGTQVSLTWNASTDVGGSGLAGYEIFRETGCAPPVIGSVSAPTTSYTDSTATPATTYHYQVRAYDGAGNRSGCSNEVAVTTPDTVQPSAPGAPGFSSITGGTATATWTAASDNVLVTGYRYSLNGGSSWTTVGNFLSANLTGLTLSTQYTLLVQAGDAAGNWGPSSSGSFITSSFYTDNLGFVGGTTGGNPSSSGYLPPNFGALSPNTLSGGKTIASFYTSTYVDCSNPINCVVSYSTYFNVSGFSGNPGASWLQSLSPLGLTGPSAVFSCSSGTCTWYWPTVVGLQNSFTLTVTHL